MIAWAAARSPGVSEKIISGGQTGADRAALDFALDHGIPHGGWCPMGRLADKFVMESTFSEFVAARLVLDCATKL